VPTIGLAEAAAPGDSKKLHPWNWLPIWWELNRQNLNRF